MGRRSATNGAAAPSIGRAKMRVDRTTFFSVFYTSVFCVWGLSSFGRDTKQVNIEFASFPAIELYYAVLRL